jgi:hypothetical protein
VKDRRRNLNSGPRERRKKRSSDPDASGVGSIKDSTHSKVAYDSKGNPILEWRTDEHARRADDDTVDYLKALDSAELELADDKDNPKRKPRPKGYNPYDKSSK